MVVGSGINIVVTQISVFQHLLRLESYQTRTSQVGMIVLHVSSRTQRLHRHVPVLQFVDHVYTSSENTKLVSYEPETDSKHVRIYQRREIRRFRGYQNHRFGEGRTYLIFEKLFSVMR